MPTFIINNILVACYGILNYKFYNVLIFHIGSVGPRQPGECFSWTNAELDGSLPLKPDVIKPSTCSPQGSTPQCP